MCIRDRPDSVQKKNIKPEQPAKDSVKKYDPNTVSYTHLDVYKRQAQERNRPIDNGDNELCSWRKILRNSSEG